MPNNKQPITVTATINAPVAKVWDIYTTPKHIMQWNSASPDWHTPRATNDLRVGGRFVSTMAARDGSFSFDFSGVYTTVTLHECIAYTMDDTRTATITFAAKDNATLVQVTFEAEDENSIEMQQGGWQAILNSFKAYTETN